MAGILGRVASNTSSELFAEMLRCASLFSWYETHVCTTLVSETHDFAAHDFETHVSETRLASSGLHGLGACVTHGDRTLVFYGELFDSRTSNAESAADFLLNGLEQQGKAFLRDVEGRFQAALWNEKEQKITLFCDIFATRPLYWTQTPDGFCFAAQMKTLLLNPETKFALDREALIDFFTWGHYFHTHTSVKNIEVLPPAGFYTYDFRNKSLSQERYFEFPVEDSARAFTQSETEEALTEVEEAFHDSVLQHTKDFDASSGLGISLSGGLDARSILGMIPKKILKNTTSVALGVPGSADHFLASQLAQFAGTTHFNYELNTDFLENYDSFLSEMVRLTDGQYLSASIVIPTLAFYREKGIETLLRGHAGELFHMEKAYAFSLREADRQQIADGTRSVEDWAWSHLQAYMLDGVETELLKGISVSEFKETARNSLRSALSQTNDEREGAIWRMYIAQRVFREIPLSMRKFDSHVNVRLPILNRRLVEAVFRLPTPLRMGETIQRRILKRWRPDFLRVRNVNTGTYIGASLFRQKIAGLKQKILAKLNFPGCQPYEKMGLWLRRELRPLVNELVLQNGLVSRGIFNSDTLLNIVRTHNEGQNHTYLILALMILEKQIRTLS